MEKIKNKIHTLGALWLNPVGKLTLLNVVLAVYPIYICSIALSSSSIVQEIRKELRRFLWKGGKQNGNKKLHLISWDMVCRPKNSGGAGVKDLATMNLAMRAKLSGN